MKTRLLFLLLFSSAISVPSLAGKLTPVTPATAVADSQDPQAKSLSPFEQSVIDAQRELLGAVDKGDVAYVQNVVADDFLGIGTSGDTGGKGEMVAQARHAGHGQSKEPAPILYDFKVVQLDDSAAVLTYNAVLPDDRPRYQHISGTWVKQGDQWRLKFWQSTPNLWSAADFD